MLKTDDYSDALLAALRAVAEMDNPNYLLLPVDPSDEMADAGAAILGISAAEARQVYQAMLLSWASSLPH